MSSQTVEIDGEVFRIAGLQIDRRRSNDLTITLPDSRTVRAHGRRPGEEEWEVYFEDKSGSVVGTDLGTSLADLLRKDDPYGWGERFVGALG